MTNAPSAAVRSALRAAEQRGYHAVIVGEHALRIVGRFGDPTLGALEVMLDAEPPLGVQADGVEGHRSALCLWTGPDLFAITLGEGGRWEHFRVESGLPLVRDSWRGGARGRYRIPRGPLVQSLPEAVTLAESWGFARPETSQPPTRRPAQSRTATPASRSRPARRTDAGAHPTRAARPTSPARPAGGSSASSRSTPAEPTPNVCPTCFMVLPATGRCDYCS